LHLVKGARVQQDFEPCAGGQFAFGVLHLYTLGPATLPRLLADAAEFQNTRVFFGHRFVLKYN